MSHLMGLPDKEVPRSRWQRLVGHEPLSVEARSWYKGVLGEIAVGERLAQLGPEWTVLHAVPVGVGDSDIDHVVIGPAGVFTLNTKNHTGRSVWVAGRTFMMDGQRQPYFPKAVHEAARAAGLLTAAVGEPVPVAGLLVLLRPKSLTIKEDPDGITVVTDRQLVGWLQRHQPVLTSEQVERITAAAALPPTWHSDPPEAEDSAALQEAFDALRGRVQSARRRRRARMLGGLAARSGMRFLDRLRSLVSGLLIMAMGFLLLLFSLQMASLVLSGLAA